VDEVLKVPSPLFALGGALANAGRGGKGGAGDGEGVDGEREGDESLDRKHRRAVGGREVFRLE
jgi:hypothetical protein